MENPTNNTAHTSTPRPFGYWLRAVDRLLAREFETAFEAEGATRRDWRLLSLLDGDVVAPELSERLQRGGGKKLRGLVERGWLVETDGSWTVTDEGHAAKERLSEAATGIREKVAGAVSDEDIATTMATLEAVARELGWDPDERMPRGFGRRSFGPRHGFGPRPGFGPRGGRGFDAERGHGCRGDGAPDERRGHGQMDRGHAPAGPTGHGQRGHGRPGHTRRAGEHAFERGFDAGFSRGAASRDA